VPYLYRTPPHFSIFFPLKKAYTIILALIALFGGCYALIRFTGINPDELFPKSPEKTEFIGTANPEKLEQLRDSVDMINSTIHREEKKGEPDEKLLKNLKETQKNLWERISLAKNAINKAETPKSIKEEENDLVNSLIKGISITAAILLAIIIFLIIRITRRAKEVEKVTERLKSLQTEPSPPPLGGIDPTVFSTRFRQLPQVKPQTTTSATTQTSTPEPPKLRKTAKQRVTEAVKKMVEALDNLRKDGGTKKTQTVSNTIRVPSLNSTKTNPTPVDETNYDRRGREKKQILDYARQGRTPSEIAKWLGLPRDQVETVIRLARERGE